MLPEMYVNMFCEITEKKSAVWHYFQRHGDLGVKIMLQMYTIFSVKSQCAVVDHRVKFFSQSGFFDIENWFISYLFLAKAIFTLNEIVRSEIISTHCIVRLVSVVCESHYIPNKENS